MKVIPENSVGVLDTVVELISGNLIPCVDDFDGISSTESSSWYSGRSSEPSVGKLSEVDESVPGFVVVVTLDSGSFAAVSVVSITGATLAVVDSLISDFSVKINDGVVKSVIEGSVVELDWVTLESVTIEVSVKKNFGVVESVIEGLVVELDCVTLESIPSELSVNKVGVVESVTPLVDKFTLTVLDSFTFELSVKTNFGVVGSKVTKGTLAVLSSGKNKLGVVPVESVTEGSVVVELDCCVTLESITFELSVNKFAVVESVTGGLVLDSLISELSVKFNFGVVGSVSKGSVDNFSVSVVGTGPSLVELDSVPEVVVGDIIDSVVVEDDMSLDFSVEIDSIVSESSFATVVDLIVVDSADTGIALGEVDLSEEDDMDILVDLEVTVETVVKDEGSGSSWYSGKSPKISLASYGTSISVSEGWHIKPSPVNPSRQEHWKLPKVFVHSA